MTLAAPSRSQDNKLVNPPFAVDRMYRAVGQNDFRGESRNMAWDPVIGGMVVLPRSTAGRNPRTLFPGGKSPKGSVVGTYTSQPQKAEFEFHEILPSWNLLVDEETQGYRVYVRVAGRDREWSPWIYFGGGGILLKEPNPNRSRIVPGWGTVRVDYIMLEKAALYFQYRVELKSAGPKSATGQRRMALVRFFLSYSNTSGDRELWETSDHPKRASFAPETTTSLGIPYRCQGWVEDRKLASQICCPTSLAMILEKYGINKPTTEVAAEVLDKENSIYGNWPRTAQVAARYGFEAHVERFRRHEDVQRLIANGFPVMASIRITKGDLGTEPQRASGGHLILLQGFTKEGDYIVNDPDSPGPGGAERIFSRQDLQNVWIDKGGVGIVYQKSK
ncbi:MAG: C39 family peptidase [Candidatus Sumerlaeaceae bacterium]|nr:C39 family peptidase [Candidatus Sumerlaeaceae bacterium]